MEIIENIRAQKMIELAKEACNSIGIECEEYSEHENTLYCKKINAKKNLNIYICAENECMKYITWFYQEKDDSKFEKAARIVSLLNSSNFLGNFLFDVKTGHIGFEIISSYYKSTMHVSSIAEMILSTAVVVENFRGVVFDFLDDQIDETEAIERFVKGVVRHEMDMENEEDDEQEADVMLDIICQALDSINYRYERNNEERTVFFLVQGDDLDFGNLFTVDDVYRTICLFTNLKIKFDKNDFDKIAYATCHASQRTINGGFFADDEGVYFKMVTAYNNSAISPELVNRMLEGACEVCDLFNDKFQDLADEKMTLEQFLKI